MTLSDIKDIIALLLLGGILLYREWQHARQVSELTNKLMAGTLPQYAALKRRVEDTPKPDQKPKNPDRLEPKPVEFVREALSPAELADMCASGQAEARELGIG